MPDHLHMLLQGESDTSEFKRMMKRMRQRSAIAFRRLRDERLWQDGYFDRVLRHDESTATVIEYLARNPARAGIVERAEDYPYIWIRES